MREGCTYPAAGFSTSGIRGPEYTKNPSRLAAACSSHMSSESSTKSSSLSYSSSLKMRFLRTGLAGGTIGTTRSAAAVSTFAIGTFAVAGLVARLQINRHVVFRLSSRSRLLQGRRSCRDACLAITGARLAGGGGHPSRSAPRQVA